MVDEQIIFQGCAPLPCANGERWYFKTLAGEVTGLVYQKYSLLTQDSKYYFSNSLYMYSPKSFCMEDVLLSAEAALAQGLQNTINWALECLAGTITHRELLGHVLMSSF